MKKKKQKALIAGAILIVISFILLIYSGHLRENKPEFEIPMYLSYGLWLLPWIGFGTMVFAVNELEKKKRLRIGKYVIVVYAVLILCGIGLLTGFALQKGMDKRLVSAIGGTNRTIESAVSYVDESATDENLTIQLKEVVSDGHHMLVLFDVKSLKDLELHIDDALEVIDMRVPSEKTGFVSSMAYVVGQVSEDGKRVCMIASLQWNNKLESRDVTLHFENFISRENANSEKVVKGVWEFPVTLSGKDISKTVYPDTTISIASTKIRVDSIDISPLSCYVYFRLEEGSVVPRENWQVQDQIESVKLKLKDGTVLGCDFYGSSWDVQKKEGYIEFRAEELFESDEIQGLSLAGTEVHL